MGRIWKGMALATVCASLSGQALALSCAQPDVGQSFNWWAESQDTYYVGVGSLHPLAEVPERVESGALTGTPTPPPPPIPYRFDGHLLGADLRVPVTLTITVTASCAASWCGSYPKAGTRGLMPLKGTDTQDLSLDFGPCPGNIFPVETEARVNECLRAGRCPEPTLR